MGSAGWMTWMGGRDFEQYQSLSSYRFIRHVFIIDVCLRARAVSRKNKKKMV